MTKQTGVSTSFSSNFTRALVLVLGGLAGAVFGACEQEPDEDDGLDVFGEQNCEQYCKRAVECDDERNQEDCVEKCIKAMGNCQADEQDAALEQLEICANESCDDFFVCTISAGATCYFGIGS